MKVLLVEDSAALNALLGEMLRLQGHTIEQATSAEAALQLLSRVSDIDVILSDVFLPNMSGVVFAAEARMTFPTVGIVLMTGKSGTSDGDEGSPEVLHKPFTMAALERALATARVDH